MAPAQPIAVRRTRLRISSAAFSQGRLHPDIFRARSPRWRVRLTMLGSMECMRTVGTQPALAYPPPALNSTRAYGHATPTNTRRARCIALHSALAKLRQQQDPEDQSCQLVSRIIVSWPYDPLYLSTPALKNRSMSDCGHQLRLCHSHRPTTNTSPGCAALRGPRFPSWQLCPRAKQSNDAGPLAVIPLLRKEKKKSKNPASSHSRHASALNLSHSVASSRRLIVPPDQNKTRPTNPSLVRRPAGRLHGITAQGCSGWPGVGWMMNTKRSPLVISCTSSKVAHKRPPAGRGETNEAPGAGHVQAEKVDG